MPEILLRPNRRAIFVGMVLPGGLVAIGLALALGPLHFIDWLRGVGWMMTAFGSSLLVMLLWYNRQPRIAYEARHLLLYLRHGPPIRLPVELVQCAFLGNGSNPVSGAGSRELRTANLVMRLDEKAVDWAEISVKPALGRWSEGYITIHGAWCEPLTLDVVQKLNVRLHELNQPAVASAPASGENHP